MSVEHWLYSRVARTGDNGRFVVAAYKNDKTMDNKHIVTSSPGINPATKDEYKNLDWYENHRGEWTEFLWTDTQAEMGKDMGKADAQTKMDAFRHAYYKSADTGPAAREHLAVMNDYEFMAGKVKGC